MTEQQTPTVRTEAISATTPDDLGAAGARPEADGWAIGTHHSGLDGVPSIQFWTRCDEDTARYLVGRLATIQANFLRARIREHQAHVDALAGFRDLYATKDDPSE